MVIETNLDDLQAVYPALDGAADGILVLNSDLRITFFNRAAEEILGVERSRALGRRCRNVLRSSACDGYCAAERTIKIGRPMMMRGVYVTDAKGKRLPVSILTEPLRDRRGRVIGATETFRDLTRIDVVKSDEPWMPPVNLVGRSHAMSRVLELVPLIAESDTTVFIEGEIGTGKDEIAQAIHELSSRRNRPLVVVRCGSIPESLVATKFFGPASGGSRPDSRRRTSGCFELAGGGTVFLDEIDAVPLVLQNRLLRVLNKETISTDWDAGRRPMDARLITATDKNIAGLVDENRFLKDLYYRIDVVRIAVPPLRRRRDDIPLLVDIMIQKARNSGGRTKGTSPEVMNGLMNYCFPGNVRELQKIIELAVAACSSGVIRLDHLPYDLTDPEQERPNTREEVEALQRSLIISALERHGGNRWAAAAELSIDPSTLWRRAKRLGIEMPKINRRICPRRD